MDLELALVLWRVPIPANALRPGVRGYLSAGSGGSTMGTFNLVRMVRLPFDRERVFPVWYLMLWIMLVAAAIVNLALGGSYDPLALALYAALVAWAILGHFVGREKPLVHRAPERSCAELIR
jgi:hypothetical protein